MQAGPGITEDKECDKVCFLQVIDCGYECKLGGAVLCITRTCDFAMAALRTPSSAISMPPYLAILDYGLPGHVVGKLL